MKQLNSSVVISNIPWDVRTASWVSSSLIPATILFLCFLLGVPGNVTVIIPNPNWQHLSTLSQSLMLNLAISDLLCLLTLPLWIYTLSYSWTTSLVTCKLLAYLIYCSVNSSLLTVMVLSAQRYLQVVHPQRCFNHVEKERLLVLLWLVAIILSIPALVHRQLTTDQRWTTCPAHFSSPALITLIFVNSCLNTLLYVFASRNVRTVSNMEIFCY